MLTLGHDMLVSDCCPLGIDNVYFTPWRYNTVWGSSFLFEVYLRASADMLALEWDYFINLSGADMPLRPLVQIEDFLRAARSRNSSFLKGRSSRRTSSIASFRRKQGLTKTFYQCSGFMYRLGSRNLPETMVTDGSCTTRLAP